MIIQHPLFPLILIQMLFSSMPRISFSYDGWLLIFFAFFIHAFYKLTICKTACLEFEKQNHCMSVTSESIMLIRGQSIFRSYSDHQTNNPDKAPGSEKPL